MQTSYYSQLVQPAGNVDSIKYATVISIIKCLLTILNFIVKKDILPGVVMVTINMDNEDLETAKNIIGEYPPSFPYLILLIDGVAVPYNSDEFIDFMIMGKKRVFYLSHSAKNFALSAYFFRRFCS